MSPLGVGLWRPLLGLFEGVPFVYTSCCRWLEMAARGGSPGIFCSEQFSQVRSAKAERGLE